MKVIAAAVLLALNVYAVWVLIGKNLQDKPDLRGSSITLGVCLRHYAQANDGRFPNSLQDRGFLDSLGPAGEQLINDIRQFQQDPTVRLNYVGSPEILVGSERPILVVQKLQDEGWVGFTILDTLRRVSLNEEAE